MAAFTLAVSLLVSVSDVCSSISLLLWYCSVPFLLTLTFEKRLIYLFKRHWQREEIFFIPGSLNGCIGTSWAMLNPRARNCPGFPHEWCGPTYGPSATVLSAFVGSWTDGGVARTHASVLILCAGITGGGLSICVTVSAFTLILKTRIVIFF